MFSKAMRQLPGLKGLVRGAYMLHPWENFED